MPTNRTVIAPHLQPAKVVTGGQLRAGRALLGWSSQTLATAARVHSNTVGRWEAARTLPALLLREPYGVRRMREAMEGAGIRFFIRPSPGVRLCKGPSLVMPPARRLRPLHGVPQILRLSCDRRRKTPSQRRNGAPRVCGARTRVGGTCRRRPMRNGRCRLHGGCSTGPRTKAGRARLSELQKRRWAEWHSHRGTKGPEKHDNSWQRSKTVTTPS
jgi:hypothetical protein